MLIGSVYLFGACENQRFFKYCKLVGRVRYSVCLFVLTKIENFHHMSVCGLFACLSVSGITRERFQLSSSNFTKGFRSTKVRLSMFFDDICWRSMWQWRNLQKQVRPKVFALRGDKLNTNEFENITNKFREDLIIRSLLKKTIFLEGLGDRKCISKMAAIHWH